MQRTKFSHCANICVLILTATFSTGTLNASTMPVVDVTGPKTHVQGVLGGNIDFWPGGPGSPTSFDLDADGSNDLYLAHGYVGTSTTPIAIVTGLNGTLVAAEQGTGSILHPYNLSVGDNVCEAFSILGAVPDATSGNLADGTTGNFSASGGDNGDGYIGLKLSSGVYGWIQIANDFGTGSTNFDNSFNVARYQVAESTAPNGGCSCLTTVPESNSLHLLSLGFLGLAPFRRKFFSPRRLNR